MFPEDHELLGSKWVRILEMNNPKLPLPGFYQVSPNPGIPGLDLNQSGFGILSCIIFVTFMQLDWVEED